MPESAHHTWFPEIPMIRTLLIAAATGIAFGQAAMAAGDPVAGKEKAVQCQQCHGPDGNSPVPQFPKLGGQHAKYIVQALEDYQTGARQEPIMAGFSANLSKQDREDLAAWYASQGGGVHTIEFNE